MESRTVTLAGGTALQELTREPAWAACERCGQQTAKLAKGPTVCHECQGKAEKRAEALRGFGAAIPEGFAWAAFEAPEMSDRTPQKARALAVGASERGEQRVALVGRSGTGKTSLAVAMGRAWAERQVRAPWFASAIRLGAARLRSHAENEVDTAVWAPLLILDDVGSERDLPSSPISEVLHERHAQRRPTWVTTWMNVKDAEGRYGEGIARRLFGEAVIIDCEAK